MATLAPGGRITRRTVQDEISRLRQKWRQPEAGQGEDILDGILGPGKAAGLDPVDRIQLGAVVQVCRTARSMSEAGRILFSVSRMQRKVTSDADRLREYLARFGIQWPDIHG